MKRKKKIDAAQLASAVDSCVAIYAELSVKCTELEGTLGDITRQLEQMQADRHALNRRFAALENAVNAAQNERLIEAYFYGGGEDGQ